MLAGSKRTRGAQEIFIGKKKRVVKGNCKFKWRPEIVKLKKGKEKTSGNNVNRNRNDNKRGQWLKL